MTMMLGDLLAAARRSSGGLAALVVGTELAGRIDAVAAREGISPAVYARRAVADFDRFASEEDWATLVSRLRNCAGDPGAVCLEAMVNWRLSAQAEATAAEGTAR